MQGNKWACVLIYKAISDVYQRVELRFQDASQFSLGLFTPFRSRFQNNSLKKKVYSLFLCCFHPTLCVRLVVLSAALFIHDDFEANVNELIWTHRPKVTDSIYCVVFSLSHVLCVAVAAFNLIRLLFSFLLLLICTIRRCECVCVCVEKRPHAVTFSRWYGNRTFSFEPL